MLNFQLGPEFRAGAAKLMQPLSPLAEKISSRVLGGARNVVIGGVAGWSVVVVAGAVMMANAAHEKGGVAPSPTQAPPAIVKAEPPAAKAETAAITAAPLPAPSPAAKTTQRVDMTPTASIPAVDPAKPKHKPHKKKPKEVDNHN